MDSGARGCRQLVCSLDAMVGCMRLVKPSKVFSRAARRATPFWEITFPEWRCETVGKSRFLRNTRASSICRPMRWICWRGRPLPRLPYLYDQSSFQQFRSIYEFFFQTIITWCHYLTKRQLLDNLPRRWCPSGFPDLSAARVRRNPDSRIGRNQGRVSDRCTGAGAWGRACWGCHGSTGICSGCSCGLSAPGSAVCRSSAECRAPRTSVYPLVNLWIYFFIYFFIFSNR